MRSRGRTKKYVVVGLFCLFCAFTLSPLMAYGEIPRKINYQGYLTDTGGIPIEGPVTMFFYIYDVPTGGTHLWTESQTVTVTGGIYSIRLGDATPIGLPFDVPYYLGVKVGSDPEMTPRVPLTSVGYAFRAKTVEEDQDTLGSLSCSAGQVPQWNGGAWSDTGNSPLIYGDFGTGKVCINGCKDPGTTMDINGQLTVRSWAAAAATTVCRNGNTLSTCSSSLRYKEEIEDLGMGMETVEQLRPVTFKWKDRDEYDIGLIAESRWRDRGCQILTAYGRSGEGRSGIEGRKQCAEGP